MRLNRFSDFRRAFIFTAVVTLACAAFLCGQDNAPAASKVVGTVKSVSGNTVVLTLQDGSESTITFKDGSRILQPAPGQTDLKNAPQIQISDIQVGDRLATKVTPGEGNTFTASTALVMKQGDIEARKQQEQEAWRRGVGGIVKSVDLAAGTITLNNALVAQGKAITVHVSAQADIKRYAANSIKFDDARPGTLDQVRPGDQLRARGTKNEDGTEFTAQAIVSGSFKDIAGTVISTDAAANTVTMTDLATKKPVTVKIGPESMLRKLPQMMAMGIAMRLKGGAPGAAGAPGAPGGGQWQGGGQGGPPAGGRPQGAAAGAGGAAAQTPGGAAGGGGYRRAGGGGDFQQLLRALPPVAVSDLNKGDAVILVATEGSTGSGPTVITMLSGVEPILSAAPAGMNAAATVLSPWNLGQGAGGDAAGQ